MFFWYRILGRVILIIILPIYVINFLNEIKAKCHCYPPVVHGVMHET